MFVKYWLGLLTATWLGACLHNWMPSVHLETEAGSSKVNCSKTPLLLVAMHMMYCKIQQNWNFVHQSSTYGKFIYLIQNEHKFATSFKSTSFDLLFFNFITSAFVT